MALTRPIIPMPKDVDNLLLKKHLFDAYTARPAYQRNDYLGWIERAKRPETRFKRIDQMLAELELGDTYMKMAWNRK